MSESAPIRDAMIVAGGRGTRLQPLTYGVPKPLLEFCGEPFLAGVIRRLAAAGVTRVFLIVGANTGPFERLRPLASTLDMSLVMVPEPEPLDTGGGVRDALDEVDDAFFVLNGDILTDVPFAEVAQHHRSSGADATIVLHRVEDTASYGVCVREGTRIVTFVEKPEPGTLPGQDAINAGTYIVEPEALRPFPKGRLSFERDVFPRILDDGGHLEGFVWDGVWADLGTPARWRAGHRLALAGKLSWPTLDGLEEKQPGVRVHKDATVDSGATLIAPVAVLAGAKVSGQATVGPNVLVGPGTRIAADVEITDSVLGADNTLGKALHAKGLVTGGRVVIESGAKLGTGVVVGHGETVISGTELADRQRVPPARG